jgi:hypothetical protein
MNQRSKIDDTTVTHRMHRMADGARYIHGRLELGTIDWPLAPIQLLNLLGRSE